MNQSRVCVRVHACVRVYERERVDKSKYFSEGGLRKKGFTTGNFHSHGHTVLSFPSLALRPGQLRGVSRKEIKGNHPYSFTLVRLTACMPACLLACIPWAMFMLCPA